MEVLFCTWLRYTFIYCWLAFIFVLNFFLHFLLEVEKKRIWKTNSSRDNERAKRKIHDFLEAKPSRFNGLKFTSSGTSFTTGPCLGWNFYSNLEGLYEIVYLSRYAGFSVLPLPCFATFLLHVTILFSFWKEMVWRSEGEGGKGKENLSVASLGLFLLRYSHQEFERGQGKHKLFHNSLGVAVTM